MLEKAMQLCEAAFGAMYTYDRERWDTVATRGIPSAFVEYRTQNPPTGRWPGSRAARVLETKRSLHILDLMADESYQYGDASDRASVDLGGARTLLLVPLLKEAAVLGIIAIYRQEVRAFSDKQVALLENFAAQAVIAMENARLLGQLQERTAALAQRNSEYGERIEHQSATIDVLKAMSTSPSDPQPVFDLIVRHANKLCNGNGVGLFEFDGSLVHLRAHLFGDANHVAVANYKALFPMVPTRESISCRAILDKQITHVADYQADPEINPSVRAMGYGAQLSIPVMRDGSAIGVISLGGQLGGFTDSQIALLQTFAEQAAIAITSAGTFRALQNRTAELTRSVAELQALEEVLRAVNSSLDLDTVLATIISRAVQLSQADEGTIYEYDVSEQVFVPKSAFGMSAERVAALRERRIKLGETHLGRSAMQRAPVYVEDVQQDPSVPNAGDVLPGIHAVLAVPLLRNDAVVGGLVIRRRTEEGFASTIVTLMQTFAGQSVLAIENAQLFQEAGRARAAAEAALTDLRRTQDRLVQTEKMASLGQLTAGIAHEIKNPLNFVNNFSDLSADLLDELREAVAPEKLAVASDLRAEIDDITTTLKGNLEKIAQHGRRADSIVKNMLLHSRSGPSEHRAIDLNTTVEEALNLAYHGARAETPGYSITMEKDLDPRAGTIEAFPQELVRVLLNLINNGFYAARKHANETTDSSFEPKIRLSTRNLGDRVEIRVRDNGAGIPADIKDKLFQPFFTTKPTGEGTGLGLSISYDIVTKQHGGTITVDSEVGDYAEFTISLPRRTFANDKN
jgi:two-component system, NtrC family, sensor kinase